MSKYHLQTIHKDTCLYTSKLKERKLILALYVDDGLLISDDKILEEAIKHLSQCFEITVLNPKCFVRLELHRNPVEHEIKITQKYYIKKIVERFALQNCKAIYTPFEASQKLGIDGCPDGKQHEIVNVPHREAIGALLYLSQRCRPDIAFPVNLLSRF